MDSKFLISIITPTYNSSRFIRETINAIINQTYLNWELLVTDDCSDDNTWEILKEYSAQDSRIKLFQLEQNLGGGIARNNSIMEAKGRFLAFCDSDDVWMPDKLSLQLDFMLKNKYEFTFTSLQHMREDGVLLQAIAVPEKVSYADLLKKNSIGCLTVMIDIERIGKVYLPPIRKRQDYGLWLDTIKLTEYAYGFNEILANYRERNDSLSRSKIQLLKYNWELLRDYQQISFAKSIYYIMFTIFNTIKKYYLR